jgi:predicted dehydrogenase
MVKQNDGGGEVIRIALAGCGEHSRSSHAAPLSRYASRNPGEIELVAACDLNAERAADFCRTFGFARAYTDLSKMLDVEKIDGCVCVMPMDRIVDTAIQVLERRIPCVIEKPLGISVAQAELLARTARETQTAHMISVNRRFMPYLNQALVWMKSKGPLRYARAVQVRYARNEEDFIWATAIHVVDAMRHVGGEIDRFEATIQRPTKDAAPWYVIALRFESGATAHVEILPTSGMVEESYEFFGDGFRALITAGAGTQRSLKCWHQDELVIESAARDDEPEDLRNGSYQEVEEFVRALRTGGPPSPGIDDILPSARICFAIADSLNQ